MAGFDNGVSSPGGVSYAAPLLSFASFGDWGNQLDQGLSDAQQRKLSDQQQQLNTQRLQQGQQQIDLSKAFQGGLPVDPKTGAVDYGKAAQILAQKGDINGAVALLQQQPPPLSPMFGGGQPQASGQPQSQPQGQPTSVAARPLPAPATNSPQGDTGSGTVASIVTDRMPNQDATTGQTIAKVAQALGVDPNATLTPGQLRRAQGLVQRYASSAPAAGTGSDNAGEAGGNLPPSANAVTPKPQVSQAPPARPSAPAGQQPQQVAPIGAGGPQATPQPQQPAPQQALPQQPQGPITPQVPLPKGFTDPQAAILALRAEAARLSGNPRAGGQVSELNNWAERIENSIKPVAMRSGETLLDPKTGQPIYQGNQPTMAPDAINGAAERYLQTGTLPPNLGRGAQGSANGNAIQERAAELARERNIDPAELPGKWQDFKAQQVAKQRFTSGPQGNTIRSFNVLVDHLDTLGEASQALKNGDIRVFNAWKQNWAAQTGNPAPTNFDGVKALVGDEIVKAVVGSAGALADREEVKKDLDRASSPKQLAELVDRYRKLALGQLKGLRKQYEVATKSKDFGDMLLPGTLAALGGNEGKGSAPDAEGWVTLPNGARIQEVK